MEGIMAQHSLISAADAREHVQNGSALLVCAYDSDEKFTKYHLEGAIPLNDFKAKAADLPKDQEVIFYCG